MRKWLSCLSQSSTKITGDWLLPNRPQVLTAKYTGRTVRFWDPLPASWKQLQNCSDMFEAGFRGQFRLKIASKELQKPHILDFPRHGKTTRWVLLWMSLFAKYDVYARSTAEMYRDACTTIIVRAFYELSSQSSGCNAMTNDRNIMRHLNSKIANSDLLLNSLRVDRRCYYVQTAFCRCVCPAKPRYPHHKLRTWLMIVLMRIIWIPRCKSCRRRFKPPIH